MNAENAMQSPYNDAFYDSMTGNSLASARLYCSYLFQLLRVTSVIDVGCGRGAWLKACHELGADSLTGLDGEWNNQASMIDSDIRFLPMALDRLQPLDSTFDLAISVEVAEHLPAESAENFVARLAGFSDAVMFGAALPGQGGVDHINEQFPSYWARLFKTHGFVVFDLFRQKFWGHPVIACWYQQNTFLYVREQSLAYRQLVSAGHQPLDNLDYMDCVHPVTYRNAFQITFGNMIRQFPEALAKALQFRWNRLVGRS